MCGWQCFQTVHYEQKTARNSLHATEERTEDNRIGQDREGGRTEHVTGQSTWTRVTGQDKVSERVRESGTGAARVGRAGGGGRERRGVIGGRRNEGTR